MKASAAPGLGQSARMREHNGLLPLRMHAMIEPIVGVLFIAAPWIFGFSDASDATTVSIVLGALVLLTGLTTRWRMGVVKLLSLGAHRAMDILVALVAIVSPFVLGFSDNGAATRFLIIMGVLELGATAMTRWDERDEFAVAVGHDARGGHAPMAR
jgi:SPW repeat